MQGPTDGTIPARHTLGGIIPGPQRNQLLRESIAAAAAAAAAAASPAERRAHSDEDEDAIQVGASGNGGGNAAEQAHSAVTEGANPRGWRRGDAADAAASHPAAPQRQHAATPDGDAGAAPPEAQSRAAGMASEVRPTTGALGLRGFRV